MKKLLIVFVMIVCIAKPTVFAAGEFSLKVEDNYFEIINGDMKVCGSKRKKMNFSVSFGKDKTAFIAYFHKMTVILDCLMDTSDDGAVKRVELMSKPFENMGVKYQFLLNIEVRAGKPYVYVQSSMINLDSSYATPAFTWSWRMKSDKYSADGGKLIEVVRPYRKFPFIDCIFLPSAKENWGLALNGMRKNLVFYSNRNHVERTRPWEKANMGFMVNQTMPKAVKKGESIKFNFVIFNPKDKSEAKSIAEKMKKENMFPGVWPERKE